MVWWKLCGVDHLHAVFQGALLLGYAYADVAPRNLGPKRQPQLHIVVALIALLTLPIPAPESWKPAGGEEPISRILLLLSVTIGLPYVLLSTTSPLIQSYFAHGCVRAGSVPVVCPVECGIAGCTGGLSGGD